MGRIHRPVGDLATALHGIIRSDAGEQYWKKLQAVRRFMDGYGVSLEDFVLATFGTATFRDREVVKSEFVLELLHDRLSLASWRYIRDRLRSLATITDRRHTEEYAFDVVLGWVIEEFVISRLRGLLGSEISIARVGVDAERELESLNIRATADMAFIRDERRLSVDLFVDHSGSWSQNKGMDLKRGKLSHFSKGTLDCVLGLDLTERCFFLVFPENAAGRPTAANAAMGGTETARVPLGAPQTLEDIANAIRARLGASPG
jgi:hypothetical protein